VCWQCVAVYCNALQYVVVWCSVLQCVAVCCSVLQCVAVCCSAFHTWETSLWASKCMSECVTSLQHTATHCNTLHSNCMSECVTSLQHAATHCNALQRTATHYNTLQHTTATHSDNTLQHVQISGRHIIVSQHMYGTWLIFGELCHADRWVICRVTNESCHVAKSSHEWVMSSW